MAAAFRTEDRIHFPLTAPLEDLHPTLAHLKTRWPATAAKLREFIKSPSRDDFSHAHTRRQLHFRGDEDLVVFNIFRTKDDPACYGVGPSPLSPLYLVFQHPHPMDSVLRKTVSLAHSPLPIIPYDAPKTNKLVGMFSPPTPMDNPKPPFGIENFHFQVVTQRRAVALRHDSVLGAVPALPLAHHSPRQIEIAVTLNLLWQEYYIEYRIAAAMEAKEAEKKKMQTGLLALGRRFDSPSSSGSDDDQSEEEEAAIYFNDYSAAKIYKNPHFLPPVGLQRRPVDSDIMHYAGGYSKGFTHWSLEEIQHSKDFIEVFFHSKYQDGKDGIYWFVFEEASWKLRLKPVSANSSWNRGGKPGYNENRRETILSNPDEFMEQLSIDENRKSSSSSSSSSSPSFGTMKNSKKGKKSVEKDVDGYIGYLYGSDHFEPLMSIDMVTGQMWVLDSIRIELVDLTVSILGAVVNLEKGIKMVVEGEKKPSWHKSVIESFGV